MQTSTDGVNTLLLNFSRLQLLKSTIEAISSHSNIPLSLSRILYDHWFPTFVGTGLLHRSSQLISVFALTFINIHSNNTLLTVNLTQHVPGLHALWPLVSANLASGKLALTAFHIRYDWRGINTILVVISSGTLRTQAMAHAVSAMRSSMIRHIGYVIARVLHMFAFVGRPSFKPDA